MLRISKYFLILISISSIFAHVLFPKLILAQEKVRSTDYNIQFPNLNSGAGIPSSSNYTLNSTLGQTVQGIFSSSGYTVRSGFQYIQTIIPFTFELSKTLINFNTLTPGTPSTDNMDLTVKAGGAGGYSVKVIENHQLRKSTDLTVIPDTQCDTGPCTESSAENWTSSSTYGFGYNMQGDDVPGDFATSNDYRPFPDESAPDSPATVMTKSEVTWDYPNNAWPWESIATITYKVNISSTQPAGLYQNVITFIAIPSF